MSNPESDERPLITNDFKLSHHDLQKRIDWVGSEIAQLSTNMGVTERLKALRHIHSQLIAQQALMLAMSK